MRILILGGGGREHALAWNMKERGNGKHELYIAPGNPGTASCGTNINISISDFDALADFCLKAQVEMVIAGPEEPLVKGVWDFFQKEELKHIAFIGPSQFGAQLEGSKAFAKAFMQRHNIPTAAYREFSGEQFEAGLNYLKQHSLPIVLKADGLAAGKGVVICQTHEEAIFEFEEMLVQAKFGDASKTVVVEQFLDGIEMSAFVLTNGKEYILLPEAKDYKRIGEKDSGLNTGGMGAVSPVPFATEAFMQKVTDQIIVPTVKGLDKEGINYTGFIFIGLIKVNEEPLVIEYNCRMGDPETEVVMPRLKNDLAALCLATVQNKLSEIKIETDPKAAVTVVAVSGGYPESFEKGYKIEGIHNVTDSIIFQAGTKEHEGHVVTSGGRVLCATSFGNNISEAVAKSKEALAKIRFDDMYFRKDIGYEFE